MTARIANHSCELREMAVGNTFGATALSSYGGFWISFGIILTPGGFGIAAAIEKGNGAAGFYDSFGFFLFVSRISSNHDCFPSLILIPKHRAGSSSRLYSYSPLSVPQSPSFLYSSPWTWLSSCWLLATSIATRPVHQTPRSSKLVVSSDCSRPSWLGTMPWLVFWTTQTGAFCGFSG